MKTNYADYRTKVADLLSTLNIAPPPCGFDIGEGWFPAVAEALQQMVVLDWDRKLAQVKQKFCELRIYLNGAETSAIQAVIRTAAKKCATMCEACGQPHGLEVPMYGCALCEACRTNSSVL